MQTRIQTPGKVLWESTKFQCKWLEKYYEAGIQAAVIVITKYPNKHLHRSVIHVFSNSSVAANGGIHVLPLTYPKKERIPGYVGTNKYSMI